MNRKGFTMIELLGTLVIISILLLIAVPSFTNILENNKQKNFVNDAKKFIALAKAAEKRTNALYNIYRPTGGCNGDTGCYEIDISDIEISPYGKKYSTNSFVEKRGTKYFVYLIDDANHKIEKEESDLYE